MSKKHNCKILKGKEYIFEDERPFISCHASTLAELDDGTTIAAWFGGTAEKNPDVAIWYSKRVDGKWSKPKIAADEEGLATWNPVLLMHLMEGLFYTTVGENDNEWHKVCCFVRYEKAGLLPKNWYLEI